MSIIATLDGRLVVTITMAGVVPGSRPYFRAASIDLDAHDANICQPGPGQASNETSVIHWSGTME